MTALVVSGLVKGFGAKPVLTGVDLQVESGTLTAILGPSGSGKTTLLRVICGFEQAQAGSVELDGEIVDDATHFVAPERRGIGYVPQEGNLFPHLTVAGNIRFGLSRGAESKQRVATLLDMIGLADRARSYPHQLSGGQQQRVALARALAVQPRLVLLDEPFASLDASLRASVRADVAHILRDAGATALLVTHDQDEALSMSNSVAVIRDGVIAQFDSPHAVYSRPVDADLAHFVGDVNLLTGSFDGKAVRTALGRLSLLDAPTTLSRGATATVMVRPEQLLLSPGDADDSAACEVVDQEFYGHDAIVRLKSLHSGGPELLVVRVRGGVEWPRGSIAAVSVDGSVVAWSE
ncbi:MAG TPA: ABC transporter ATP-binding protein [Mycobacteriales bacterium]|nr:ABC transporter ATP-binding protein [Mycobacteriales bacterium]